jgi:hypothetical protein
MRRLVPFGVVLALAAGAIWTTSSARAQQAGAIRITSPTNNSTINQPVSVTVEITGVTVKPAAEGDPNAFHYHLFVDVDPATVVQPGQPIVTGQANIIHTADRTVSLDLAPGQHTVTAVLSKTDHVPLSPSVQDRVTFTVGGAAAAGGQTPPSGTPRTGTGTSSGAEVPFAAVAALVVALGAGLFVARRRSA